MKWMNVQNSTLFCSVLRTNLLLGFHQITAVQFALSRKKIKGFDESSSKAHHQVIIDDVSVVEFDFFRETTYYFTVKLLFSVFSSNGVSSIDLTIFKIKNLTTRGQLLMLLLVVIRLNLLLLIMSINLVLLVVMIPIRI